MRQYAYLVVNPIMVNHFASPFSLLPVSRASDSMMDPTGSEVLMLLWARLGLVCCLVVRVATCGCLLLRYFSGVVLHPRASEFLNAWILSSLHH